jgi:hypothetical protein
MNAAGLGAVMGVVVGSALALGVVGAIPAGAGVRADVRVPDEVSQVASPSAPAGGQQQTAMA